MTAKKRFFNLLATCGFVLSLIQSILLPAVALAASLTLAVNAASSTLPTSVAPSTTFSQNVSVTATNGSGTSSRWGSTQFTVNGIAGSCQTPSTSVNSDGTFVRTFSVTSPATDGSYAVNVTVYERTDCTTTGGKASGFAGLGNLTVITPDTTAPVIDAHSDVTAEAASASGATVSYTAPTTIDNVDPAGSATCLPSSGSLFALGDTTVTCNATDVAGNSATPTAFTVHVVDTTAPVIDAHSDVTAEVASASGAVVTYTSPATTDLVDGADTASCLPASGTTFALGDTVVTCTAQDAALNSATPTTFTVTVSDTTAPVIDAHSDVTAEATGPDGATVSYDTPNSTDLVDGIAAALCTPSAGSLFALGITTVTCDVTDIAGNNAVQTSFTVTVQDTTGPVINEHVNVFVEATGPSGALVTYADAVTSDAVDGDGVADCSPASNNVFAIGLTEVTCTATDASENSAEPVVFYVVVLDTTAPVIAPHDNITMQTNNPSGAAVSYVAPATTDVVDGTNTASCTAASGAHFAVGNTIVTCTATDAAGNQATPVTFAVSVTYTPIVLASTSGNNSDGSSNFTGDEEQNPSNVLSENSATPQTSSISTVADNTPPKAPKDGGIKDWWWLLVIIALLLAGYFGYKKYQQEND